MVDNNRPWVRKKDFVFLSLNGIVKLPNKSRRYQKKDKAKATEGIKTTDYNFVGTQYSTVKKMQYCKYVWRDSNLKSTPRA